MAKGFGTPPKNSLLGYVLIVVPDDNIYACSDPNNEDDFGITNLLDMAMVWPKKSYIQKYLDIYAELLSDTYYEDGADEMNMQIAELHKNKKGELKAKVVKTFSLVREYI
jgi:hypothetical protein